MGKKLIALLLSIVMMLSLTVPAFAEEEVDNTFEPFHPNDDPWADDRVIDKSVYMDPNQPIEVRVEALLSQMTLSEKAGQTTQLQHNGLGMGNIGTVNGGPVREFFIGSFLYAGGGVPSAAMGGNTPEGWLHFYNVSQYEAVFRTPLGIPILVEIDAVHGTGHAPGTTIFPHNIGLGAAYFGEFDNTGGIANLDLARDIGRATSYEMSALGYHFTFSPCIPVALNMRWGRTSEGFGTDSAFEGAVAAAVVEGYQGGRPVRWDALNTAGTTNYYAFLASETAMGSTMKHFIGEGITVNGINQGQLWINATADSEDPWPIARVRDAAGNPIGGGAYDIAGTYNLFNLPIERWKANPDIANILVAYEALVQAGARSIMPTFNSINGLRAHQLKSAMDVVKLPVSEGGMGFTGFVVGDYMGHTNGTWAPTGQVLIDAARHFYGEDKGLHGEFNWDGTQITSAQFRNGLVTNAGMDLMMAIGAWIPEVSHDIRSTAWYSTQMMNVMSGRISVERLDDAVRRILRVKFELGLFDNPFPAMDVTRAEMEAFGRLDANSRTNNEAYRAALLAAVESQGTKLRDQDTDIFASDFTSTTELAREAVRQSLVLLKNAPTEGGSTTMQDLTDVDADKIMVAGRFASRLGWQLGDWVREWQGEVSPWLLHHNPGFFYEGTTLLDGMELVLNNGRGGRPGTVFTPVQTGDFDRSRQFSEYGRRLDGFEPEVIILTVGETPYSEGNGDAFIAGTLRNNSATSRGHAENLQMHPEDHMILRNVQAAYPGVPIILVGYFGRPMTLENIVNDVDAVVSAWWPGTEGGLGVAEMLFTDEYEFVGRTPFPWAWYPEWIGIDIDSPGRNLWDVGAGLNRNQSSNARTPNTFVRPARQTTPIAIGDSATISGTIYTHDPMSDVFTPGQPVFDKGGYLASTRIITGGLLTPGPYAEGHPYGTATGAAPPVEDRIEVSFFAGEPAWVEYLIDVGTAGSYRVSFVSSRTGDPVEDAVTLSTRPLAGGDATELATFALPLTTAAVTLAEGVQVLRIEMQPTATNLTIDSITITLEDAVEFDISVDRLTVAAGNVAAVTGYDRQITVSSADAAAGYTANFVVGDSIVAGAPFTGAAGSMTATITLPVNVAAGTQLVTIADADGRIVAQTEVEALAFYDTGADSVWVLNMGYRSNMVLGVFNRNIAIDESKVTVHRGATLANANAIGGGVITGGAVAFDASAGLSDQPNEALISGFQTVDLLYGDIIEFTGIMFPELFGDTEFRFTASWSVEEEAPVEANFDIIVETKDYGSAATAVVLDMGTAEIAAAVDLEGISIHALAPHPTNPAADALFDGPRTITGYSVDGQFITIELLFGQTFTAIVSAGGDECIAAHTGHRPIALEYTITLEGYVFTQNAIVRPIVDDFALVQNPVEGFENQNYRVFIPEDAEGLPLVLWNHGGGEGYGLNNGVGNEGSQLRANMGGVGWVMNAPEDAIILAPQRGTALGAPGYSRPGVIAYIEYLIAEGIVDANRVYMAGPSAGGGETHNFMREFPNMWAAAIPICITTVNNPRQVSAIRSGNFPVWIVTATNDPTTRIQGVRNSFNALKDGGVEVYITEFTHVWGNYWGSRDDIPENPDDFFAGTDHLPGHWSWVQVLNNELHEAHGTTGTGTFLNVPGTGNVYSDDFTWADDLIFEANIMDWLFKQYKVCPFETATEFSGTRPADLNALLAAGNVNLKTPGNYGIARGTILEVPVGSTLFVSSVLNVRHDAELIINGSVVVLPGGRINNDGSSAGGGTITIGPFGRLENDGYVENVSGSSIISSGTLINNARFEVRANTTLDRAAYSITGGSTPLNIHRNAILP